MLSPQHFIIPPELAGRLDVALTALFKVPRAQAQRLIKAGGVTVNGKVSNAHAPVKAGDEVGVEARIKNQELREENFSQVPKIEVVAATEDYVVINKPAGLLMHPVKDMAEPSVIGQVVEQFPEVARVGEEALRPGLVQRLDRDVSGVVVIARSQAMFDHLKRQFADRSVIKEYVAVVIGLPSKPIGVIDFPISRSQTKGRKMAVWPRGATGQTAVTHYEVLRNGRDKSLLRVIPKTGRTNQIRAHLAAIGYPIVGDPIYKPKKTKVAPVGRIYLHALRLIFWDLAAISQTYQAPLPDEFLVGIGEQPVTAGN